VNQSGFTTAWGTAKNQVAASFDQIGNKVAILDGVVRRCQDFIKHFVVVEAERRN